MKSSVSHTPHHRVRVFRGTIALRVRMHPDKKQFLLLLVVLLIISGGLLAWRFQMIPSLNRFFAAQNETQAIRFESSNPTRFNEIGRANTYDYSPSIIQDASGMKVYVCGGGVPGDSMSGHDAIYLTQFAPDGTKIIDSQRVIAPTINTTSDDSMHACAPSVIRHSFSLLENGANKYLAYYECAPKTYLASNQAQFDMFTQICVAYSDDGITWKKYNSQAWEANQQFVPATESATPIITINPEMARLYSISVTNGKYITGAPLKDGAPYVNGASFYGVGHPSAIVHDGKIWLYYYDSVGMWGDRGLFLRTSDDGFHFSAATKISDMKSPAEIKYIQSPVGAHPGYFVALGHAFDVPYFNYSWDGITWQWEEIDVKEFYTVTLAQNYQLSLPQAGTCIAPGGLSLVSDASGVVHSSSVIVATNEGKRGNQDGCSATNGCTCYDTREDAARGSTWQAMMYNGTFSSIGTVTTQPLRGDLNGDGSINASDLDALITVFGHTSDFGNADLAIDGKIDIFDYNELVKILNQ